MLKEKWNTGLRKGLIISLSVLLMSSFVFSFGTKKVLAYGSWYLSSTHYNVEVSQADSVGTQLIVSWAPKNASNSRYSDLVTIKYVGTNTRTFNLLLYGEGTQQVTIATDNITSVSLTTSSSYNTNVSSELYLLNTYLPDINDILTNTTNLSIDVDAILNQVNSINSEENAIKLLLLDFKYILEQGIALKNYDIQLYNVAALSYFASCNGEVVSDTNAFTNADTLFFDYPIMLGYQNITPTTSKSLFMYPGMEYIFIVIWNRTSALFNSNNYTFNVMSGYETPVMKRSYQNTLASSMIVNGMIINPTENQSRFTIDWSSTFVNYLNSYQYIPLYFGPVDQCPDEYLRLLNYGFSAEEQAGTTSEDLDDVNTEFNSQISEIDDIQNDLENDFQTNIQAIDTDLDFEESFGQKFITSAQWVRTQFETLTTQNPYGSILFFALTLGLALMIIGRVI